MEKLWKRGNYVKLFDIPDDLEGIKECDKDLSEMEGAKNPVITSNLLKEANQHFAESSYNNAINTYTSILRYATNGSELGMAYEGRAISHFSLGRFHEALVDIDLAIKVSPPEKLTKLLQYRKIILDLMNKSSQNPIEEHNLDFGPDENFPSLANVVELQYNEEFGRHYVANSDIPENKTILKEECFTVTQKCLTNACYACSSTVHNFIPCKNCSSAIFCNTECKDRNKTHKMECGSLFGLYGLNPNSRVNDHYIRGKFDIHTVMNAIVTFGDVNTLMGFVERTLLEDQDRPPVSKHNDEACMYGVYFKLKKFQTQHHMTRVVYTYVLAMKIPQISKLFDTTEKQRFLMHLITHHAMVNSTNSFDAEQYMYINNGLSFFNHSCDPNAETSFAGNSGCAVTRREIKKDEEICVSYLSEENLNKPRRDRQELLLDSWGFLCKCSKCQAEC